MMQQKTTREIMESAIAEALIEEDPLTRCRRVHELMTLADDATKSLAPVRREDVDRLLGEGITATALADVLNVSVRRIGQIRSGGSGNPAPERAFFGSTDTPVTVVVAQKLEAGKSKPMAVVSVDDVRAYEKLRTLVEGLGFTAKYEVAKPPGFVQLNRDNLICACGPRHSEMIAMVLERDDHIRFERDEQGFYLVDRTAGVTYRSPEDKGIPGDFAYLARHPRLDGHGSFLYISGIHATGDQGAAHYLATQLPELYREVKLRPFSVVLAITYDPETHEILSSEPASPIYKG